MAENMADSALDSSQGWDELPQETRRSPPFWEVFKGRLYDQLAWVRIKNVLGDYIRVLQRNRLNRIYVCMSMYSYIYKEIYHSRDYGSKQVPSSAGSGSKPETQKNQ